MSYLDTDTTKPTQEILSDIRAAAQQSHMPGLGLLPFSTLLVRLSQEASVTADKNLLIQKRMIVITFIVLGISIAQLVIAFLQFTPSPPNNSQSSISIPKAEHSKSDQKSVVPQEKAIQPSVGK